MDDVDKIIFQTLKTLGWELENDCDTLREASLADIASGLVKCFQAIDSNCNLPNSFPQNITQRYKAATAIADCIKELEYPGEVGYQTIMYPNETELRKIFMFLIDKLPKESPMLMDESNDRISILHRKAKLKIKSELGRPWIPFHCIQALHKYGRLDIGPILLSHKNEGNEALGILLDRHTEQLASSKLDKTFRSDVDMKYERKVTKLVKIPFSLFEHSSKIAAKPYEDLCHSEENISQNEEQCLYDSLKKRWTDLNLALEDTVRRVEVSKENIIKSQLAIKNYTEMVTSLENQISCLKEFPSLEGDAQQVKTQLLVSLQSSKEKEKRVMDQWIKHKKPFETELLLLEQEVLSKQGKAEQMRKEIMEAREHGKQTVGELNRKKKTISDLQTQLKNSDMGINRSEYTDKILDITNKVEKQRQETDKVIVDIRQMHKEVNGLTGKLSRTFNHVENVVFNKLTVWKDLKEEYRLIISIHEAYGELNDKLYEILNVNRETASVKQQVETQKKENIEKQLEALQIDLENILKENKLIADK